MKELIQIKVEKMMLVLKLKIETMMKKWGLNRLFVGKMMMLGVEWLEWQGIQESRYFLRSRSPILSAARPRLLERWTSFALS